MVGAAVMMVQLTFAVALVALMPKPAHGQSPDSSAGPAKKAVISGVVKDQYGDPVSEVEIRVDPGGYSAHADRTGRFRVEAPTGQYNVVFRRVGYAAEDFSWRARSGEGTELSIRLNPLPYALDTVVIRDSHNRVVGASMIAGVVVDGAMQPLKDVELLLIGTGRHAISYDGGEFFFAGLAKGNYVLRARRLGFSPVNLTVRIGKGEEHGVAIKLTALPQTLATVQVRERSGFGKTAILWEEFDRRQRWKSTGTVTVGRDELARSGKTSLDWALARTQAASLIDMSHIFRPRPPASIRGRGPPPIPGDVCVLENGVKPALLPLSFFRADEVERVEVVGANSDWTGTIGARMAIVKGCAPFGFQNPPYYVVWVRGGS